MEESEDSESVGELSSLDIVRDDGVHHARDSIIAAPQDENRGEQE